MVVQSAKDKSRAKLLELQIDRGESSAISYAMEQSGSTVILDDLKARRIATALGIKHTGTIGIIIKAKLEGHMDSIQPALRRYRKRALECHQRCKKKRSGWPGSNWIRTRLGLLQEG